MLAQACSLLQKRHDIDLEPDVPLGVLNNNDRSIARTTGPGTQLSDIQIAGRTYS